MTQGYQLDHSLSQRLFKHFFDNVLLEHVNTYRRVFSLAVHLFFFNLPLWANFNDLVCLYTPEWANQQKSWKDLQRA